MRTPGQGPGSRPGGEGTPPKAARSAWAARSGPEGEHPPDCHDTSGALSRGPRPQGRGRPVCHGRFRAPMAFVLRGALCEPKF